MASILASPHKPSPPPCRRAKSSGVSTSAGIATSSSTVSTRSGRAASTPRAPESPASARNSGNTSEENSTGVPRVPRYDGAAIALPLRCCAASSAGMTVAGVSGWSPSATRAAAVHGLSAAAPTAIEEPCPSCGRALTAKRTARPASASRTAGSPCPGTTTRSLTWGSTSSTLQRTTGLPLRSRRSFWRPMRRANPAASTIAAITASRSRAEARAAAAARPGPRDPWLLGTASDPARNRGPLTGAYALSICVVERVRPCRRGRARRALRALRALDRGLEGAPGEHAAEMRLVLHGALEVGLHVHAVGGLRGGGLDGRGVQTLARERRLHALGAHGLGAGAGDADARLRALAILVECDDGRHADDREARRRVRELQIRGPGALGERGHADLDEQLVLLQRRLHQALEPVLHLHRALLLALADELGAERDHGGGHVGGGIAVGQRAADRSLVAHGGVADHGRGLRHDRAFALQHLRGLYLPVGGHRPERDRAAGLLDAGEPTHLAQVDEMLRLGEAQLHHRDQAVTTRQDRGVVELAEQLQGLRDAGGGVLLERGWVHGRLLYRFGPAAPAVLAAWMVFHTRSGESGIVSM